MSLVRYLSLHALVHAETLDKLTQDMHAVGHSRLDDYVAELLRYHATQPKSPLADHLYPLSSIELKQWNGVAGIYIITNEDVNRAYIGSAVDLVDRGREHIKALRAGTHHNRHLQSDFTLQRGAKFYIKALEVVATADAAILRIREQVWLDRARVVYQPHRIYNLATPYAGDTSNTPTVPKAP